MTSPCPCWSGPVSLHSHHCCFGPEAPDGCHESEGMPLHEAYVASLSSALPSRGSLNREVTPGPVQHAGLAPIPSGSGAGTPNSSLNGES